MFILASLLFFIWSFRNILFWVALWQNKEYRLDRLLVHFKETSKGRDIITSWTNGIKWFLIFFYPVIFFQPIISPFYELSIVGLYIYEAGKVFKEILERKTRRPAFTFRAFLVAGSAIVMLASLFVVPLIQDYLWLVLLDKVTPFIVAFCVYVFSVPSEFVKDALIERATRKMKKYKDVIVIGISGSYGKSSTKEYVAQILSKKFQVLKTKGSENTPIGISRAILSGLAYDTDIFVVELGSYKRYEVAELCAIVRPTISITTAVSDQHLSLFGSIKNVIETEYELIASLPRKGMALFNGNGENMWDLYTRTHKKKILYGRIVPGMKASLQKKLNITATNITVKKKSVEFDVFFKEKKNRFEAPLLGGHTIENILPGLYLAHHLGMSIGDIKEAVSTLLPLPQTMVRYTSSKGYTVIDDSFNASPESVRAAIEYMTIYSGKKYLVFEPMIELGSNAKENHYILGKMMSEKLNHVLLTNKNFYESIAQGIKDGNGQCSIDVYTVDEAEQFIKRNTKITDIVLLEGKEAGMLCRRLTKDL